MHSQEIEHQKIKDDAYRRQNKRDMRFLYALITPALFAFATIFYTYFEFSSQGVRPPALWVGIFLASFLVFVVVYFICMTIYLWTL